MRRVPAIGVEKREEAIGAGRGDSKGAWRRNKGFAEAFMAIVLRVASRLGPLPGGQL